VAWDSYVSTHGIDGLADPLSCNLSAVPLDTSTYKALPPAAQAWSRELVRWWSSFRWTRPVALCGCSPHRAARSWREPIRFI